MEFVIRRIDGNYFDLPYNLFSSVLHPNSVTYEVIEGWGSHRIEVAGCQIAFSDEVVGFQVVFDNCHLLEKDAQKLVEEVLENIESVTGQQGEVIQTS